MRAPLVLALLLPLCGLAGCGSTIQESDDVRLADPGGLERMIFGDYWEARDFPSEAAPPKRIAIASFRVELVLERLTAPDKYNMSAFKVLYGGAEDQIVEQLYDMFAQRFVEHGREVLPIARTVAAPSYKNYPVRTGPEVVSLDRPIQGKAGQIRRLRICSSPRLALVEGDPAAVQAADTALLQELGVDVVLHVSLRVGVWNGRATIEEGCVVTISGARGPARLTSRRTLASHASVLQSRQFTSNISGEYHVHAERYARALEEAFPPYIGLAATAIRR